MTCSVCVRSRSRQRTKNQTEKSKSRIPNQTRHPIFNVTLFRFGFATLFPFCYKVEHRTAAQAPRKPTTCSLDSKCLNLVERCHISNGAQNGGILQRKRKIFQQDSVSTVSRDVFLALPPVRLDTLYREALVVLVSYERRTNRNPRSKTGEGPRQQLLEKEAGRVWPGCMKHGRRGWHHGGQGERCLYIL